MEQSVTASLITKQTDLQKHLEEIQGNIRQIQEQLTNDLNMNTSLEGLNEELQEQLRGKDVLLNTILEAVKSTETKFVSTISAIKDLTLNMRKLEQQVKDLMNNQGETLVHNVTLQRVLKDLRDKSDRQRRETQAEREADNRKKEELCEQIQTLQSRAETLEREKGAILREKEDMQGELLELRHHSTNYQAVMANVAHEMTQLRQTSENLSRQLQFQEAQKTESENNIAILRQEKETLQGQVVQAKTESQELRRQANTQATNIDALTGALQAMQRQAMSLLEDADRDRHEVQRLEAQLRGTRDLVRSRDGNIAVLREDIRRRDADLEAARTRQEDLERVLRARSLHVWRYQTEVEEGRKTIRILQEEVKLQSFREKSSSFNGK